jgi:hypothetical protein
MRKTQQKLCNFSENLNLNCGMRAKEVEKAKKIKGE